MKDIQQNHYEENQPLKVLRDVLIDRSSRWLADFPLGGLADCERSEEEERGHKKEEGEGPSLRGLGMVGVDASQMSPLGPTALLVAGILLAAVYDLVISPTSKCAQQKFLSSISYTRGWGMFCLK